jgi:hypothetical protein
MVEAAINRAQPPRETQLGNLVRTGSEEFTACGVRLGDLDLAEDEP